MTFSVGRECADRPLLILAHEATIALDIGTEDSCELALHTPSFPDTSKGYPPSFLQRDFVWNSGLQLGGLRALPSRHFLYSHETSAVVENGQLTTRGRRSVSDCLGFDEGVALLKSKSSDRFQRVLPNARGEPRPEAGAQRTLEGVGSTALFGPDSGRGSVHGRAPSLMAPRASDSASRVHDDLRSADDLVRLEQDLRR